MLGIKNKVLLAAIIAVIVMAGTIGRLEIVNANLRADNKRQTENMEQITAETQRQLKLKADEYEALNADWKDKIDSIRSEYDIKLKHVKQATVTKVVYRDTGSVKVVYGDPKIIYPDSNNPSCLDTTYKIPISLDDGCLGFKGNIESQDNLSTLTITERHFENSIQILVTEKRRWIFWKDRKFQAFSDCGNLDITQVDFEKD